MSGIFAIFCDDIDSEAYCPGEGSCCVTGTVSDSTPALTKITTTKTPVKTSSKPVTKTPIKNAPNNPSHPPSSSGGNDFISQILQIADNLTGSPTTTQESPPQVQRCPGFCLLNIMAAFCERPSVLISTPTTCAKGSLCCDNSR